MQACEDDLDSIIDKDLFKILAEPVRIKIIRFLALNGPCDIGTIAAAFPQDRSVISRHLKLMQVAGMLCAEKHSRNTVYTFDGLAFLERLELLTGKVRALLVRKCPALFAETQKTT